MATLTIEKLDDELASRLRSRADASGRSIGDEATDILREALGNAPLNRGQLLLDTIRAEFGPLGGVELDLPPRGYVREPPRFDDW